MVLLTALGLENYYLYYTDLCQWPRGRAEVPHSHHLGLVEKDGAESAKYWTAHSQPLHQADILRYAYQIIHQMNICPSSRVNHGTFVLCNFQKGLENTSSNDILVLWKDSWYKL